MPQLLLRPPWPTDDEGNRQPWMSLNPIGPNRRDAPMAYVSAGSINYKRRELPSSVISHTGYEQILKFSGPDREKNGGELVQRQVDFGGLTGCLSLSFRGEERLEIWGWAERPHTKLLPAAGMTLAI